MAAKKLKASVVFAVSLVNAFVAAKADGKFDISDLGEFLQALKYAPDALSGLLDVPGEWARLDAEAKAEIYAEIDKLDLADNDLEAKAEKVLKIVVALGAVVGELLPKAG